MIYFIVLAALLFLSYRYDYCKKSQGRLFSYLVMFAVLVLIAGLRYRIGTDSVRYERYYEEFPYIWELRKNYFLKVRFEPGFVILMSLCKSITSDFTFFQFVCAIVTNSAVFYFIYKNTRHIFFGIFLYSFILYTQLNFEVLREAFAVSIFLLAWIPLKRNNLLVYYLLILLAITFHVGSTLCLLCPLFFIPGLNYFFTFGKRTLFICIGILAIGFTMNYLFFDFIKLLSISASITDRATAYSKNELGGSTLNLFGALGTSIRWVIYPLVSMYFINYRTIKKHGKLSSDLKRLEALSLMSVYIGLISIPIQILFRFNDYFFFFSIAIISSFIFSQLTFKHKTYKLNFLYWIILLIPLFYIQARGQIAGVNNSGSLKAYMSYYPYASRLDREEDRHREAIFRYYKSW